MSYCLLEEKLVVVVGTGQTIKKSGNVNAAQLLCTLKALGSVLFVRCNLSTRASKGWRGVEVGARQGNAGISDSAGRMLYDE
jgi:hypothetical protein